MKTTISFPTRVAILRTMGALHKEPLRYDLQALRSIVLQLAPDLMCADITRENWESGRLHDETLEVREALAPVITLTDSILVPIAPNPEQYSEYLAPPGPREWLANQFDRVLRWGQRAASTPEALHGVAFETFCHTVCLLEEMTWKQEARAAYQRRLAALTENILAGIQRDPGGRVLVVIRCQWQHGIEKRLKQAEGSFEIVPYLEL